MLKYNKLLKMVSFKTLLILCCLIINSTSRTIDQINDLAGTSQGGEFGVSLQLAADVNTLLVGEPSLNSNRGIVKVYELVNNILVQKGQTIEDTPSCGSNVAVSHDGNVIASVCGDVVKSYDFVGGNWVARPDLVVGDNDVLSVSLDGNGLTLTIGFPLNDIVRGKVNTFSFDRSGNRYSQIGQTLVGPDTFQAFGDHVSVSGDGKTVMVSTRRSFEPGFFTTFRLDGDTWNQIRNVIKPTDDRADECGKAMQMTPDAKFAIVGCPSKTKPFVQVYEAINEVWVQRGSNIIETADNSLFGTSVSISRDGSVICIGAPGSTASDDPERVFASVYEFSDGDWQLLRKVVESSTVNEKVGKSVSINKDSSGQYLISVGIPNGVGTVSNFVFNTDGTGTGPLITASPTNSPTTRPTRLKQLNEEPGIDIFEILGWVTFGILILVGLFLGCRVTR